MAEDFVATYGLDTRPFIRRLFDTKAIANASAKEMNKGINKFHENLVSPFTNMRSIAGGAFAAVAAGIGLATAAMREYSKHSDVALGQTRAIGTLWEVTANRIGRVASSALSSVAPELSSSANVRAMGSIWDGIAGSGVLGEFLKENTREGRRAERAKLGKVFGDAKFELAKQMLGLYKDPDAKRALSLEAADRERTRRFESLRDLSERLTFTGMGDQSSELWKLHDMLYEEQVRAIDRDFKEQISGAKKSGAFSGRSISSGLATAQLIGANLGVNRAEAKTEKFQGDMTKGLRDVLGVLGRIDRNTEDGGATYQGR